MRQRQYFIGLWLNEAERQHLLKQCQITGLSVSALIRHSINGIQLRPRPPDEYVPLIRQLKAIGNNINQIAFWANAQKSASEQEILQAAELTRQAVMLVKEKL